MDKWKKHKLPLILALVIIGYSCASMGTPDGGPYDEMPPKFVGSKPQLHAVNAKDHKLELEFDEFIKLEKAAEKVVVSPPQMEQPEIKVVGKKVVVELLDTLKPSTTYTIDFSDAIVDNNEGNPMGHFTYSFSTGATIDTMEVSGTVLSASDLEPIKGMLVGLHENLSDTAFTSLPFSRVSRTDSRGHFSIRGIAPGKYRLYALMDGNQNYLFDSKTEMVAFNDSVIIPSCMPATRQDTLWKDTLTIDTIKTVGYTRFLPDDLVLRAFKEENKRQYFSSSQRDKENHFILKFSAKADTLPVLKGLNFDEKDAFIIETNERNDSICYWIKDSLVYQMDTLVVQMDYLCTDTLDRLMPKTDTLYLANKFTKAQREKFKKQEEEKKAKERKKRERKKERIAPEPTPFLKMSVDAPSSFDLNRNVYLSFDEPLAHIDTSSIHLEIKEDTLWTETSFMLIADSVLPRKYAILAEWMPEKEYRLQIDSAAIVGLYGLHTDKVEQTLKVKGLNSYGALLLNLVGADESYIVELMESDNKVLDRKRVTPENTADFYFLPPNKKFYVRAIHDRNGNDVWDTGDVEKGVQPEEVYYFPKSWQMKENFDFEETWNIHEVPLDKQKLDEIKKQKPEEAKKVQDRNKERAKKLGRL